MDSDPLCYAAATDLAQAFRARTLSPVELLTALLDRIERLNPRINAFVTLLGEQALEEAQAAEQHFMSTPEEDVEALCGLPVMVKDLTPTAGVRTTFGSRRHADNVPSQDALIWARLKAQGAILLGKTTTPEFGMNGVTESALTGVTNNPWDVTRTVGGSSGGSAAALAAGFGPLATGSDGGGSIRVPSSFCGIVGLKASPGRIPYDSEGSRYDNVSVVGPMTRTVRDNALLLSLIAGPDSFDPFALPEANIDYLARLEGATVRGLRVAFSPDLGNPPIEPAVSEALARAAHVFERELGAKVDQVEIELPDPSEYFIRWWGPQIALDLDEMARAGDETFRDFSTAALGFAEQARDTTAADYARVQYKERAQIHDAFAALFAQHDLLLMPTTPMVAFPHPGPESGPLEIAGESVAYPALADQRCTEAISHAGYPAITIPCGVSPDGLPVGLQIAGPHRADAAILEAAAAFEAVMPWADRRPTL